MQKSVKNAGIHSICAHAHAHAKKLGVSHMFVFLKLDKEIQGVKYLNFCESKKIKDEKIKDK